MSGDRRPCLPVFHHLVGLPVKPQRLLDSRNMRDNRIDIEPGTGSDAAQPILVR